MELKKKKITESTQKVRTGILGNNKSYKRRM